MTRRRGHPWVFMLAVAGVAASIKTGDPAGVVLWLVLAVICV